MNGSRRRLSFRSLASVTSALIVAGALSGAIAFAARSVPGEPLIGGVTADEYAAQMGALHARLMADMPAGTIEQAINVRLTTQEQKDLQQRQQDSAASGPALVGKTKPISLVVHFNSVDAALLGDTPRRAGNGLLRATPDGGFVWAVAVRSQDAGAVRVNLNGLDLPPAAELYFLNPDGQAFGPYTGRGLNGDGSFWTNTVLGSTGVVLLRHHGPAGASDLTRISFTVSDVGHLGTRFSDGLQAVTESFCSFNAPCIENASCHNGTPADAAKHAVALMQWVSGGFIYTCTGGLLADTVSTSQIRYFLSANHCISRSRDAGNLETYFNFTLPCGSTNCPAQTQPGGMQVLGATIKATGTGGDYTLFELNETAALPSGTSFLGWNNTAVANTPNVELYRISHPAWAPQAFSEQHTDTSAPTCTGWPRGERIYSRTTIAGTEGGSSGSPVVNGSSQVVGQLSGACGTNVNDSCDNTSNATVDGALAFYWPNVAPFLDPSGGPVCSPAGASCSVNSDCCSNSCKGPKNNKTCH